MSKMKIILFVALCGQLLLGAEPKNLLKNGDFKAGTAEWKLMKKDEFKKVKDPVVKNGVLSVDVPQIASGSYLVLSSPLKIVNGETYKVRFDMKVEGKSDKIQVSANIDKKANSRTHLGLYTGIKKIGEGWKRYTIHFKAAKIGSSTKPTFRFNIGAVKGKVSLRNCTVVKDASVQVSKPKGTKPSIEELP